MEHFSEHLVEKLEELPTHEAVERKHRGRYITRGHKAQKWLLGHVGFHFDEVFSKWKQLKWLHPKDRTLKCLDHFATITVRMPNDSIVDPKRPWDDVRLLYRSVYFHPETKILTRPMDRREWKAIIKAQYRNRPMSFYEQWCNRREYTTIGKYTRLMREDGIWYLETYPPYDYYNKPINLWLDSTVNSYQVCKRQLNSKELKRHGLTNEVRIGPKRPDLISQQLKVMDLCSRIF